MNTVNNHFSEIAQKLGHHSEPEAQYKSPLRHEVNTLLSSRTSSSDQPTDSSTNPAHKKSQAPETLVFTPLSTERAEIKTKQAHFDAHQSVNELIKNGSFKAVSDRSSNEDYKPMQAGEAPKITVVYENKDKDPASPKPNYVVSKDGAITVVHNPEGHPPDANIVIQVERDSKQTGAPNRIQQKAIDDLVEYQASRIVDNFGSSLKEVQTASGKLKQVDIDDEQNLVTDKIEQKFADKLTPDLAGASALPAVPQDVQRTSDLMNRVRGSGGSATVPRESAPGRHSGDATAAGADQMIPTRSVPQGPKEANSIAAVKDAAAALFAPDHEHPYQTIHETRGSGFRVGRYGLNKGFSLMGMAELLGIDLGDPPDLEKLREYLKQHPESLEKAVKASADKLDNDADNAHLPKDDKIRESAKSLNNFAKSLSDPQFQQGFVKFLSDMKGDGEPITADRLAKFMPKEMQELIAEKGINHEAKRFGEDPAKLTDQAAGKIALAFFLGRTPTADDSANSQYSDYTRAGANMFKLAQARLQNLGDINVTDAQGKIVAAASHDIGRAMWQKYLNDGNLGCAASVSAVLNEAGFTYAHSTSVSDLHDQLIAHGWKTDSQPHPGDVAVGYRRPKGSSGGSAHTGIVGTNGITFANRSSSETWSQGSTSSWNRGAYPYGVAFLRPPGS